VRQHLDGTLSIFHGPRCIARHGPDGINHRSGHIMCYVNRTSQFAVYRSRARRIMNSPVFRG
jgi:hypothetical protein